MENKSKLNFQVFLLMASFFTVMMLWLPFGYTIVGQIEEWGLLDSFIRNGTQFWLGENNPLATHRTRPLMLFHPALGYFIDPNTFLGWDLVQQLGLVVKSLSVAGIFYCLTSASAVSVFAGILFVLYPADTMQLSSRSIHINWAVAMGMLALLYSMKAIEAKKVSSSLLFACLALLSFVVSTFIYEVALFAVPFPLFLLLIKFDLKTVVRLLKEKWYVWAIWILGPIIYLARYAWLTTKGQTYQAGVIGSSSLFSTALEKIKNSIEIGGIYSVVLSWWQSLKILVYDTQHFSFIIAFLIILSVLFYGKTKFFNNDSKRDQTLSYGKMFGFGFLMAIVGFFPYSLSTPHLVISQRTYLLAQFGGTVAVMALVLYMVKLNKKIAYVFSLFLLSLGIAQQYKQMDHYNEISLEQKAFIASIYSILPTIPNDHKLLIFDESGQLGDTWMLRSPLLQNALSFVYKKPIEAHVCYPATMKYLSFSMYPNARNGNCEETPTEWQFGKGTNGFFSVAKEKLIVIKLDIAGYGHLVSPNANILNIREGRFPNEIKRLLDCESAPECIGKFQAKKIKSEFFWDFGRWWSLDTPIPGTGWRGPEWNVAAFDRRSLSWQNEPIANLIFNLKPTNRDYQVDVKISGYDSIEIKNGLKVKINSHDVINPRWVDENHFMADIPKSMLLNGPNNIEFLSGLNEKDGIGIMYDYVYITQRLDGKNEQF